MHVSRWVTTDDTRRWDTVETRLHTEESGNFGLTHDP